MQNYFQIFSISEKFDIDLIDLEKKYFHLQHQFHPDKSGSDNEETSAQINEAYKILSDDFLRACYLLKLKNIDILHDDKCAKPDMATLQRILELQEGIEEMKDESEINDLKQKLVSEIKSLILESMKCLEALEINLSTQLLIKAKYLKKSVSDLKNKNGAH